MDDGGDVGSGGDLQRACDGGRRVGIGFGFAHRDCVVAGRDLQRGGGALGLEALERQLAVEIDVGHEAPERVHDRHRAGRCLCRCWNRRRGDEYHCGDERLTDGNTSARPTRDPRHIPPLPGWPTGTGYTSPLATLPALHPYLPLLPRAYELSSQARIGVYDCLYVALTER